MAAGKDEPALGSLAVWLLQSISARPLYDSLDAFQHSSKRVQLTSVDLWKTSWWISDDVINEVWIFRLFLRCAMGEKMLSQDGFVFVAVTCDAAGGRSLACWGGWRVAAQRLSALCARRALQ